MTDTTPTPESVEIVPGTPEYDAAMAANFDAVQANGAPQATPAERPSWLPEKFKSAEDLAAAYKALEAKQSQGQSQEAKPGAKPETPALPQSQEEVAEGLKANGLDYGAFEREFMETGALSQASYEKLAAIGVPKDMVDAYLDGQAALAGQIQNDVFSTVGGEAEYRSMVSWAATNLSPGEVAAFNKAMDFGSVDEIKLAVGGLQARYSAANGSEPSLIGGSQNGNSGDVFRSTAELTRAMSDPRYRSDPAYREEVIGKLSRSNIM